MDNITLFYKEGSSDKVYQAAIEPKDGGYVVTFAYGRRGTTLNTGVKTPNLVSYDDARRIFNKLVAEKTAKGYMPGADGTSYRHTDKQNQSTGILPQLLNPIEESQLDALLNDKTFVMQEKHDGRRLLIQKRDDAITGSNKLGLQTGFPVCLERECQHAKVDFLMDGEIVGEDYHAFDLLEHEGDDLRGRTYQERYLHLMNLLAAFNHPHIALVESAYDSRQKREKLDALKAANREGVVFKRTDAIYTAGRPASGGSQFKYKFTESASFVVIRINDKRSVALMLFDGDRVIPTGSVTIPPNKEIPAIGTVVECRYLYAYPGGCIFQPVYLGPRDDTRAEECTVDQLKYKPEPVAA